MLLKNAIILSVSLLAATILVGCGQDRSSTQPVAETSSSTESPAKNQTGADWKSVTLHIEGFKKSNSGAT